MTLAPPFLASSGMISGVGFAIANTIASSAIVLTISAVTIFGAFDVRASDIKEEMKIAAAKAIAELISAVTIFGADTPKKYLCPSWLP